MFMHGPSSPQTALTQPWRLPPRGLAVFHGECDAPRLSHYFLPRLALEGKRILFLDGANCANPRLMARLAERRGLPFAHLSRQIKIARAFTCFQLTELIRRVPQFLADFPAQVLMVTAFPELYFDEDIRHADAAAAFQQALDHLRRWALTDGDGGLGVGDWGKAPAPSPPHLAPRHAGVPGCARRTPEKPQGRTAGPFAEFTLSAANGLRAGPALPLTVALFSSVAGFQPPACRKLFFAQTCAAATELWKFQADGQGRLGLTQQTEGGVALTFRSAFTCLPSVPS